jgi:AcrR family transcriptional regulator
MSIKHRMAGQERREGIIRTAVGIFSQRGFRGTTTREIAAAVGVSEPVLYQHFQTKGDLYTAIIDHKFQQGAHEFEAFVAEATRSNDDYAFFQTLASIIFRWFIEDPDYVRLLLYSALEGHEIAKLCYEQQAVYVHNQVASYLRGRMEQGAVRESLDPLAAAHAFICMIVHFAQAGILHGFPTNAEPPQYIATAVDIFVRGIAKTEEK